MFFMRKILATVLALMLLLAALALVSCGDSTTGGSEDDYTETVDPEAAAIESYLETYKPEDTAVTYVEDIEKTYDSDTDTKLLCILCDCFLNLFRN